MFERNLAAKVRDPQFSADIGPLLAHGYRWNMDEAARKVGARLSALRRVSHGRERNNCVVRNQREPRHNTLVMSVFAKSPPT